MPDFQAEQKSLHKYLTTCFTQDDLLNIYRTQIWSRNEYCATILGNHFQDLIISRWRSEPAVPYIKTRKDRTLFPKSSVASYVFFSKSFTSMFICFSTLFRKNKLLKVT